MRKRVGIARALVDGAGGRVLRRAHRGARPDQRAAGGELIAELRAGVCDTAIVVTHDIEFADMVADRDGHPLPGPVRRHRHAGRDPRLRATEASAKFLAGELPGGADAPWPTPRASLLQLRIGAFVGVGARACSSAIIYLLGAQARYFERKYDLVAEFPEVGGLIEGATVRLAGVQIGRVTDVVLPGRRAARCG